MARFKQESLEDVFIQIARNEVTDLFKDKPEVLREMNVRIIWALTLRYLFLYTRNWVRIAELIFWPTMELVTWGFLTQYLDTKMGAAESGPITWLLGGVILWDVMFRSQQGVAISFLEDVWTRNLLNVFVAPVRPAEYLSAAFGVGFVRIAVTVLILRRALVAGFRLQRL